MKNKWTYLSIVFALILTFGLSGCDTGNSKTTTNNGTTTNVNGPSSSDCVDCNGTYTLSGTVKDVYTGDALVGVTVSIAYDGKVFTTTTSAAGQYSFAGVPPSTISSEDDYDEYFWSIERDEHGSIYVSSYFDVSDYILEPYTVTVSMPAGIDYNTAKTGVQAYPEYAWGKQVIGYRQRPIPVVLADDMTTDCAATGCDQITVGERIEYIFDPINDGSTQYLDFEIGQARASVAGLVHDFTDGTAIAGATVTIFDADGNNPSADATPQPSSGSTRISLPTIQATTGATGQFTLTSVPEEHSYFVIVQASGYQMFTSDPFTVPGGVLTLDAIFDGTVGYDSFTNNHAIKLIPIYAQHDLFPPYVVSVTPSDCSFANADTNIVLRFSEAMDTSLNGVTQANVLRATGFAGGQYEDSFNFDLNISAKLTWSESTSGGGYDTLTIAPVEPLYEGFEYAVNLLTFAGQYHIRDANGNAYVGWLDLDGDGIYDTDTSQNANLPNDTFAEPYDQLACFHGVGAPDGVLDFTVLGTTPECTIGTPAVRKAQYGGGLWGDAGEIDIDWPDVTDARAYNIYGSWANSPYILLSEGEWSFDPPSEFYSDDFWALVADAFGDPNVPGDWVTYLMNDPYVDFEGNTNLPFDVASINIKVAAVDLNGNECVTSAAVVARDNMSAYPDADNATCAGITNNPHLSEYVKYYRYLYMDYDSMYRSPACPGDMEMVVDFDFNEPILPSSVTAANFDYTKGWLPCTDQTDAANSGTPPTLTVNFGHSSWPNSVDDDQDESDYQTVALAFSNAFAVENGDFIDFTGLTDIPGNAVAAGDMGERLYLIDNIGALAKSVALNAANDTVVITLTEPVDPLTIDGVVITGLTIVGRSISVDGMTITLTVEDLSDLVDDTSVINLTAALEDLAKGCPDMWGDDCDITTGANASPQSRNGAGTLVGGNFGVYLEWFPAVYGLDPQGHSLDAFPDTIGPRVAPDTFGANQLNAVQAMLRTAVPAAGSSLDITFVFTEDMVVTTDPQDPTWQYSILNPSRYSVSIAGQATAGLDLTYDYDGSGNSLPTLGGNDHTVTIHIWADPNDYDTAWTITNIPNGATVTVTGVADQNGNLIDTSSGPVGEKLWYTNQYTGNTDPVIITGSRNELKFIYDIPAVDPTPAYTTQEGWHRVD